MGEHFASGNWVVSAGREDDFVSRWREFLEWTRAYAPGLVMARLIQDADDPRHFVSFAIWDSAPSMEQWRSLPDFRTRLSACRELCDDFRGSSYTLAATV